MPEVLASIIIPCYNQLKYTKRCISSILRYTAHPYELIVIDNGSLDGTGRYLSRLKLIPGEFLKRYHVISSDRNLGVSGALNRGIAEARGEYLCYLNNDTIVTPGWLNGLVQCAESDPRAGIIGCRTNRNDRKVLGTQGFRNVREIVKTAAVVSLLKRGEYRRAHFVHGFCMLFKRELVDRIGLFDEKFYPCGCEDFDYCIRARKAGYRLLNAGDVFVFHFHSKSTTCSEFSDTYSGIETVTERSQKVFIKKWGCAGRLFLQRLEELIHEERNETA